jgi:hypothetical protein
MKFKDGESVIYTDGINNKHEVCIEKAYSDNTYTIPNPLWSWEDEASCTNQGEEYDVPYWIIVNESDLEPIK